MKAPANCFQFGQLPTIIILENVDEQVIWQQEGNNHFHLSSANSRNYDLKVQESKLIKLKSFKTNANMDREEITIADWPVSYIHIQFFTPLTPSNCRKKSGETVKSITITYICKIWYYLGIPEKIFVIMAHANKRIWDSSFDLSGINQVFKILGTKTENDKTIPFPGNKSFS